VALQLVSLVQHFVALEGAVIECQTWMADNSSPVEQPVVEQDRTEVAEPEELH
jgi:hypothetical protein